MCVCVSKKTQTSPIPQAKLGEPILLGLCTTTQLRDVIVYSGRRLNIFIHFVFTGGSNFPFFHILWSWLLTQRLALPCMACTTVHTRDSSERRKRSPPIKRRSLHDTLSASTHCIRPSWLLQPKMAREKPWGGLYQGLPASEIRGKRHSKTYSSPRICAIPTGAKASVSEWRQ